MEAGARHARARGDRRRRWTPASRRPGRSATAIGRSWWRPATAAGWCWAPTRPRSHDVVDTTGCRIAEPPLDDTAAALAALLDRAGVAAYDERTLIGDLRHVVLRANHAGRVLATWVTTRPLRGRPRRWRARFRGRAPGGGRRRRARQPRRGNAIFAAGDEDDRVLAGAGDDRRSRGRRRPRRPAAALRGRLLPGQPRRRRAGVRRDRGRAGGAPGRARRRRLLRRRGRSRSRSQAPAATEVVGIEAHAGRGRRRRRFGGAEWHRRTRASSPATSRARWRLAVDRADVVVLNPPRKGCAPQVLAEVVAPRAPRHRLPVVRSATPSPATSPGSRRAATGRSRVTPFDMLPHTPHVEALAIVERQLA